MVRRFIKDSAIYAGGGAVSAAIAFLLFPFIAHTLRPREYGVIDIVGVLSNLALLTVALEINQGLGRFVATTDGRSQRSAYASTALLWSIASYTVFVILGLILARPLTGVLLGPHVNVWVMRLALVGIWVSGGLYVVQDQLRWQMRPKSFAAVSVVVAAVTTAATAIYVFVLHGRVVGVVAGQVTGCTTGLLVALALSPGIYRLRFDREKAVAMLLYSAPLVPSSIGVLLNLYADRLAIQHQESLAGVGVYGVGFRLSLVVSILLLGVQGATTPIVLARHAEPDTPRDVAKILRLFWAVGCVTFLALSILAEPFVRILSAPAYYGGARVVPLLVPAAFLAGLYVFAPGPQVTGRTKRFAAINVGAGLLNLGLAFALVPSLGIVGAGIATLASSFAAFAAWMIGSQRLYPVPHDWPRLAAGAVVAAVVVMVTRSLIVTNRAGALGAGVLLGRLAIASCGTALVLGLLVDRAELRSLTPRVHRR